VRERHGGQLVASTQIGFVYPAGLQQVDVVPKSVVHTLVQGHVVQPTAGR